MGFQQSAQWCNACGRTVLANRATASHIVHLVLTLATGGLWGIVWLIVAAPGPWVCTLCGLPCGLPVGRSDAPAPPSPNRPSSAALRARKILLRVVIASGILIFAAIVLSWPAVNKIDQRSKRPAPLATQPNVPSTTAAAAPSTASLFFFADRHAGMDGRRGYEVAAGQRATVIERAGTMTRIRTEAGEQGWIEADDECLFVGLK